MRTLKDMSVLITGGGSGIGEGAAKHFASKGAKVTIAGRREEPLQKVKKEIGELCHLVVGDVTQTSDRERMVAEAVTHGDGLETLISNAGNIYRCEVEEFNEEELLKIFHSNVVGGMMLVSECHEFLKETKDHQ